MKKNKLFFLPLFIFVFLVGVFTALLITPREKTELPSVFIGKAPPTFSLPPLMNFDKAVLNENYFMVGKLYLVNIFASWCVPCRVEHPNLMALAQSGKIEIIGINYKDKFENASNFLTELGNPYSRIGVDKNGRAAIEWGVYGVPESFFIDRTGKISHKIIGPIVGDEYEKLKKLISQN